MKISLTLLIERRPKPPQQDEAGPVAVVGTIRESKAAPARQRAAGRGTVGFSQP